MDKNYYKDYYYLERKHWWFKARLNILESLLTRQILPILTDKQNIHILNAGVATGATSIMLEKYAKTTSLEYDQDCCLFLKETVGIEAVNASLTGLPFEDESFDLVCAFDVIEHIEDHELAVAEIKRVLKPNGKVFLTVPAYQFLWSEHDEINHHFRRYTLKELSQVVQVNALNIQYSSYFNTLLFPLIFLIRFIGNLFKKKTTKKAKSDFEKVKTGGFVNSILCFIFKLEKPLITRLFRLPFGVSIVLIAQK